MLPKVRVVHSWQDARGAAGLNPHPPAVRRPSPDGRLTPNPNGPSIRRRATSQEADADGDRRPRSQLGAFDAVRGGTA
jgi:hypothetical protein